MKVTFIASLVKSAQEPATVITLPIEGRIYSSLKENFTKMDRPTD
jgi:hypothetical protein